MSLSQEIVDSLLYEGGSRIGKDGRKRWSEHIVWDDQLPGLGLRLTHTNRKTFVVSYRADGRKRRKTLGTTDELTLAEARQHASELLAAVGAPPPAPVETAPALTTVGELAAAWIDHLKSHTPTCFTEQRLIRTHITAAMGGAKLTGVKPVEIDGLKRRVARQFPADGRKLAIVLKQMFEWAKEQGAWAPGRKARAALAEAAEEARRPEPSAAGTKEPPAPAGEETAAGTPAAADESQDLTVRLDELSAVGAEMMAELTEQAAARRRLEDELAEARGELVEARRRLQKTEQAADELRKSEQASAKLSESVQQLMEALEASKEESQELGTRLDHAERSREELERRLAASAAERNELENRLLETKHAARAAGAAGRPRLLRATGWVAAGALIGALIVLVLPGRPTAPGGESPAGAAAQVSAPPPLEVAAAHEEPPAVSARREPAVSIEESAPALSEEPTSEEHDPMPATPAAEEPDPMAVERAVRAWATAWSEQRVPDYLASYASGFELPGGMTRAEWEAQRRTRLRAPASIRLEIGPLEQTTLEPGRVRVAFDQSYATESYSDRVRKILELVWDDGTWKIATETSE